MRFVSYLLLLAVVIVGVSFATLNSESVVINYYIGQAKMALSFLLVLAFAGGCVIGLLVGIWFYLKVRFKNRGLTYQLRMAEKEVQNLRNIPLQDRH